MKNNFIGESILALGTVIALLLLINPGNWWMPDMFVMTITCVAAILLFLFVSFIFRESVHDEREELHRYIAARLGYLGGVTVLMIMIVWQEFTHVDDERLMYVLGVMLLMKVAGSIYAKKKY